MKVNKKQGLLYIFDLLINNQIVNKKRIKNDLEIEDYSFYRYMQELRAFLSNFYLPYEIKYNRAKDLYFLTNNK
ncbi:MAG: hypothetical protein IJR08_02790 [Bacilli bacterium]|nr:hypothetical protein [Bacilli bacterium]